MSSRTLQPSEYEIQREVEALRDIRRRSTTPGALTIDPDLPIQAPISSSTSRARPAGSPTSPHRSPSSSSGSSFTRSSSDRSSHGASSTESVGGDASSASATDDPFHLFWVPASVHPEIAPAEFRAFLKEHARTVPPSEGGGDLTRVPSAASSSSALGRKRSMLRRQYQPRENDGIEQETIVPLRRNRTYLHNPVTQITFTDLQRLEQLAEEASESDDPSKLRTLLRRSLSLNLPPSAVDRMGSPTEMGDEADAPIIVPPPGNILRRAARTKIRKPGLPGDGNGHRFGSSKRGLRAATLPPAADQRTSSDFSSSDHGDTSVETESTPQRRQTFSDEGLTNQRPDSYSDETLIFDAYARDEEDEQPIYTPNMAASPPLQSPSPPASPPRDPQSSRQTPEAPQLALPEIQTQLLDAFGPVLQQPLTQEPENEDRPSTSSRTPSPPAAVDGYPQNDLEVAPPHPSPAQHPPQPSPISIAQQVAPQIAPAQPEHSTQPHQTQAHPPRQSAPSRREKDKKGLFGIWGGDKTSKKSKQDKEKENRERPDKEKDSGFFGALFGGSKKKQDSDITPSMVGGTAGREAAQALLGASKSSKNYIPPPSPGLVQGANPYARYPIHVERAIYRLSHIKLANPRRPLYEQVLISNLMFWYLGVINKPQNPSPSVQDQPNGVAATAGSDEAVHTNAQDTDADQELREKERLEQEQRERLEKEALERLEREKELEMKKKESGKRGSLTKTPTGGVGGRRAEMPVRGPQYEMQHRVMEQEYGNYNMPSNQQTGRGPASTNGAGGHSYHRQQPQQYQNSSPKPVSPQPARGGEQPFYDGKQKTLPPGAMAPTEQWAPPNNVQRQRSPSPKRSRTPPANFAPMQQKHNAPLPQDGFGGVGGRPGRSLSATAIPAHQVNGAKARKGSSVHAINPSSQPHMRRPKSNEAGSGEEEDLPLATLWQQQRRVV
ncbi:hypothetical protein AGABI1DRAFT_126221 [Agaricus bisporus var. burnettii JB137-S8]|uniref:Protein Zds1 C-terminal domain-containing protein n=1 Tax=Agaricus bisporus var. burnettii (strain JB137-S8 / ATCC MYA-4627 / FGSC 10392) TaxID=597362 RepID=K5W4Y1_AGABU|nr:uncharacterized protein AGABI1DRAFT_126221 [Agaricus bisporus var. burnettii JB137-S8]EKM81864.1 hypothetical protein AGABI1DRAFT_126221 [Agaricus bisporus var. burnettii JB137-S8]